VSGAAALAVTTPATASFSSTLDGTDQTPTYTLPTALSDVRGSGSGWNLQISQTQFTTGSQTLPTSASSITGTTSVCAGPGTCTAPTSNVSYASPIALPAGASPTPAKFYNAAVNTGMGKFTITPTVQVSVPANTYAGSYTSTITIASVTGP
jgi:hypothetical protein